MDQCKQCVYRGKIEACAYNECTVRESWYVEQLLARIGGLKDELRRIVGYTSYGDYTAEDRKLLAAREKLIKEIKNCVACDKARKQDWPQHRMCAVHYGELTRLNSSIAMMHELKETCEPRNIAREALAKLDG